MAKPSPEKKNNRKRMGYSIGRTPFDGYEEITKKEEYKLRKMSIEESARLTEILLREVKLWMR